MATAKELSWLASLDYQNWTDSRSDIFGKGFERATGIEPATSSLGIRITAPLFSQVTKPLRKNQCPCRHIVPAVPDLPSLERFGDGFVA
jgi:hypothetical protein